MVQRLTRIQRDRYVKKARKLGYSYASRKEYSKIRAGFNDLILEKLLMGYSVGLPGRMGSLHIEGKKKKIIYKEDGTIENGTINWPVTKKMWKDNPKTTSPRKYVYYDREEFEGYSYFVKWVRGKYTNSNLKDYSIKLSNRTHVKDTSPYSKLLAAVRKGVDFITN